MVWCGSETQWTDLNAQPMRQLRSVQSWMHGQCTLCGVTFRSERDLEAHCAAGGDHELPNALRVTFFWECPANAWRDFHSRYLAFIDSVCQFSAVCGAYGTCFLSVNGFERHLTVHDNPPAMPLARGRTYYYSRSPVSPVVHAFPAGSVPNYPRRHQRQPIGSRTHTQAYMDSPPPYEAVVTHPSYVTQLLSQLSSHLYWLMGLVWHLPPDTNFVPTPEDMTFRRYVATTFPATLASAADMRPREILRMLLPTYDRWRLIAQNLRDN